MWEYNLICLFPRFVLEVMPGVFIGSNQPSGVSSVLGKGYSSWLLPDETRKTKACDMAMSKPWYLGEHPQILITKTVVW